MQYARKKTRFGSTALLLCVVAWVAQASGQNAAQTGSIRALFVEPFSGVQGAQQLRESLIERLQKSGSFEVVSEKSAADAVVSGTGKLWVQGYNAINVRNPAANRVPVYTGYLSVQVSSKSGEPLWSYMAVPGKLGWKTVVDDLTATVVKQLVQARDSLATRDITSTQPSGMTALSGAGATFPQPLYTLWFETLRQTRNLAVSYAAVGSQEGMRMLAEKEVDFAASEADPSEDRQLDKAAGDYLPIASVLGGVVPIYNLPDLRNDVHFTAQVLADIYLGKIKKWNDPQIRKWNKSLALPDEPIVVVHRSDGSGTTAAWSAFLARNSAEWKANVGTGLQLGWPIGIGADGNQGVATTVKRTRNSIGYVELVYALQGQISFGAVQNRAGDFVRADLESLAVAANSAVVNGLQIGRGLDPGDKRAYPVATMTWLLVPRQVDDASKKMALVQMLQWALTSGQRACAALGYVPLPKDLAQKELHVLEQWK